MYVARFALWWSTMMVVMLSLGLHYLNGAPLDARVVLLDALIAYPLGILIGFSIWSATEKKYSESLNAK